MDEKLIQEVTLRVLQNIAGADSLGIPVGVSNRHIHLCREHMDILFGAGSELTFKSELMGGQFAAEECVTILGRKLRTIEKVRVLGPLRPKTQLEISKTDSYAIGAAAPLRDSGDTAGSAVMALIGPRGAVYLEEGCILARRHIHMPPNAAARFGVKDNDVVSVRIDGARSGVFDNVLVRVDESFTLEMHIDTDEANGMCVSTGTKAYIV